jgi:hypothetical protein
MVVSAGHGQECKRPQLTSALRDILWEVGPHLCLPHGLSYEQPKRGRRSQTLGGE